MNCYNIVNCFKTLQLYGAFYHKPLRTGLKKSFKRKVGLHISYYHISSLINVMSVNDPVIGVFFQFRFQGFSMRKVLTSSFIEIFIVLQTEITSLAIE